MTTRRGLFGIFAGAAAAPVVLRLPAPPLAAAEAVSDGVPMLAQWAELMAAQFPEEWKTAIDGKATARLMLTKMDFSNSPDFDYL